VVVKAHLEFKLLSATKIQDGQLLTLNLKNVGRSILKNLVVRLHYPGFEFSVDCPECFVYALMPNAEDNVTFRVFVSSLKRAYFSVSGYASGDAYFFMESPVLTIQEETPENSLLLT
jgi:hypothetical protein